jgi:phosphoserine phosphatase
MDQFEFKRFTFDHESQALAFKEKIWSDLHQYQAVSFQTEATHLAQKKLCVFDMDSTLINQEVIDEIARLFGKYDQVSKITEEAMQGKLDFTQSLQARCQLFMGMPDTRLQEILPKLSLSRGAKQLFTHLKTHQIKTAVVSGGFEFVLKHFQTQLGIDQVHGPHA